MIFDMDGLLLDSEIIYGRVWEQAAAELGYSSSMTDYTNYVGRRAQDCDDDLRACFGHDFPIARFWARQEELYDDHRDTHGIPLKHGAHDLIGHLQNCNIPRAIATSTHREPALLCLDRFVENFDIIVTGDEVAKGKPDPEIFLLAARRLNIPPQECLVLEDAEAGVRAACAAGMSVIMVPDLKPCAGELADLVTHVCSSLLEVKALLCNIDSLAVETE